MSSADGDHRALAWAVAGRLTEVAGGTLYLDEAGDLGGDEVAALERMLASANAGLVLGVGANRIGSESDPYIVAIPPLRDRKEDLRGLCFAALRILGAPQIDVDYPFLLGLSHYEFPGNVDELERILQNALAARTRDAFGKEELPRGLRARMARAFHPQR
jgi:DNA-binding NtrC family response regulator